MKKIITYLLVWLVATIAALVVHHVWEMPAYYLDNVLFVQCSLVGVIGGVFYCLRAVYVNKCVRKQWDKDWETWYYLRHITSAISGLVSCIFLKAGLLALQADVQPDAVAFGYLAVAFVAGYNVDNFAKKIEEVASSVWGIKKSRASGSVENQDGEVGQ